MRQFDMSTKELVRTYYYDDIHTNRECQRSSIVKGRTVIELGTKTASSFVGNLYRVFDKYDKQYKYLLLVGVAKQNPDYDSFIEVEEAEEAAALNAQLFPTLTYIIDEPFDDDYFIDLCIVMTEMMPITFIKTNEEKVKMR